MIRINDIVIKDFEQIDKKQAAKRLLGYYGHTQLCDGLKFSLIADKFELLCDNGGEVELDSVIERLKFFVMQADKLIINNDTVSSNWVGAEDVEHIQLGKSVLNFNYSARVKEDANLHIACGDIGFYILNSYMFKPRNVNIYLNGEFIRKVEFDVATTPHIAILVHNGKVYVFKHHYGLGYVGFYDKDMVSENTFIGSKYITIEDERNIDINDKIEIKVHKSASSIRRCFTFDDESVSLLVHMGEQRVGKGYGVWFRVALN